MHQTIKDVMTPDPKVLLKTATVKEAAELMRDDNIGDVIVVNGHKKLYGILTDRDIAIRCGAEGADPDKVTLEEIATKDVTTLSPDATIDLAITLMREQAIRRIPVVEDGKPVGIVTLGDLAIEKDPTSALADISAAPPDPAGPSSNGSGMAGMGKTLPAAAAGAGVILAFELLRNRGKKRNLRVAAKRLKKTGKKLRKTGDKAGSDATQQAAKYATAALKEIRSQGKKMKRKGKQEFVEAKVEHKLHAAGRHADHSVKDMGKRAEAMTKELSKRAEKKAHQVSKKAEQKAKEVGKKAERKARDISKKAEHKAEEIREMVSSGRR